MSKLESDTPVEIDEARLDEVSGGPIYMFEALKGQFAPSTPSAPSTPVAPLGDGSVRPIG